MYIKDKKKKITRDHHADGTKPTWIRTDIKVKGLNQILNWHWTKRYKYKQECVYLLRKVIVPRVAKATRYRVEYVHYYKTLPMDEDNIRGGLKFVTDGLRNFGLIFQDTTAYLETRVKQLKDKTQHLDIKITEL